MMKKKYIYMSFHPNKISNTSREHIVRTYKSVDRTPCGKNVRPSCNKRNKSGFEQKMSW
jgi:hypothetical protein